MIVLDGKKLSKEIKEDLKLKVGQIKENIRKPGLAVIIVGNNPASQTYVKSKIKACGEVGFNSYLIELPEDVSQDELINKITYLNEDDNVDGILVQLPLPKHLNESYILDFVNFDKDVDGFTTYNQGLLFQRRNGVIAATPKGIMTLLNAYDINLSGLNAVVIGRSQIVGLPIAKLLTDANATVTIAHSKTKDLASITKEADLIVVAIGKPKFLTADMVKDDVIIIDVGINRIDGKLVGDVDYDEVSLKSRAITKVPGGVGPMTIASLLSNCYELYERHMSKKMHL